MIRQIIHIDEEKCNGCGLCASACHEGAIEMVNGKAKLVRENFCDGFGDSSAIRVFCRIARTITMNTATRLDTAAPACSGHTPITTTSMAIRSDAAGKVCWERYTMMNPAIGWDVRTKVSWDIRIITIIMAIRSDTPGIRCLERQPESKSKEISYNSQRAGKGLSVVVFIRRDGRPPCNIFFDFLQHQKQEKK